VKIESRLLQRTHNTINTYVSLIQN